MSGCTKRQPFLYAFFLPSNTLIKPFARKLNIVPVLFYRTHHTFSLKFVENKCSVRKKEVFPWYWFTANCEWKVDEFSFQHSYVYEFKTLLHLSRFWCCLTYFLTYVFTYRVIFSYLYWKKRPNILSTTTVYKTNTEETFL